MKRARGAFVISNVAHDDHQVFVWAYQKNSL